MKGLKYFDVKKVLLKSRDPKAYIKDRFKPYNGDDDLLHRHHQGYT